MSETRSPLDADTAALLSSIELGLAQTAQGLGEVNTPEQIKARRAGGRPKAEVRKEPVTLRLDPDVLARWRASGKGLQTRAAALLAAGTPPQDKA